MVEEPRMEDRKKFMQRNSLLSYPILANFADPLKKREEFAVSLRK